MNSVQVLLVNALVYTATLIVFYKKYKFSVGVMIWALYTLSAWSSYLFIQQPLYSTTGHASEQTLLPCIYLYVVFLISMMPLLKLYKIKRIDELYISKSKLLKWIMIICTVIQFLFFVADIPSMMNVMSSGSYMYSTLRSTVYGDESLSFVTTNFLLNKISILYSGMRILATGFSIVAFITFKENRQLVNLFALSALLNNIRLIIVNVGRGEMVLVFLLYATIIFLMRDWLDARAIRKLFFVSVPLLIVGLGFFWAVSVSRFGDKAVFFIYKYLGEPINNFDGILFNNIRGTTNGRAYFSLFYKYLLSESDFSNTTEKWSMIYNATGIRGDIFYTWVGGVIIEFGKVAPFIVAIVLNRMLNRVANIEKYFAGDIAVLIFFINFYTRGIFLFPTQNYEGMLMIFYTLILYLLFRIKRVNSRLVFVLPQRKHRRTSQRIFNRKETLE